jgi:hypothetical protein
VRELIYWLALKLLPRIDIVKDVPVECEYCSAIGFIAPGQCGLCVGGYVGTERVVYLRRFFLFRSKWLRYIGIKADWGNLYLHHILRSDDDPDPHDHPWDFTSTILSGGYTDETWNWFGRALRAGPWMHPVAPGRIVHRKAEHIHRVRLNNEQPAWTLVKTGPYRRDWNFIKEAGPVLWWEYLGIPQPKNVESDDLE